MFTDRFDDRTKEQVTNGFDNDNGQTRMAERTPKARRTIDIGKRHMPMRMPAKCSIGASRSLLLGVILPLTVFMLSACATKVNQGPSANGAPSVYDDYVGRYDFGQDIVTVTREGDGLFFQLVGQVGQPKFELFQKEEDTFSWGDSDARATFVRNGVGEVTHAVGWQDGQETKAPKLKERPVAAVDPRIYDDYVGQYDFGAGFATVTRKDHRLLVEAPGKPRIEIFPKSDTEFFAKAAHAEFEFVKDAKGEVVKVIVLQPGIMGVEGTKMKQREP